MLFSSDTADVAIITDGIGAVVITTDGRVAVIAAGDNTEILMEAAANWRPFSFHIDSDKIKQNRVRSLVLQNATPPDPALRAAA